MWLKFATKQILAQLPSSGLEGGVWVSPKLEVFHASPTHYRWVEANQDLMIANLAPWAPTEPTTPNDTETSIPFQIYDRMMESGWIQVRVNKLGVCINSNTPDSSNRTIRKFMQELALQVPSAKWNSTDVFIDYENQDSANTQRSLSDFI